jgi:hypothetical protein
VCPVSEILDVVPGHFRLDLCIAGKSESVFKFRKRAERDVQITPEFTGASLGTSLNQIRCSRKCRSANLPHQPGIFFVPSLGEFTRAEGKFMTELPRDELFVGWGHARRLFWTCLQEVMNRTHKSSSQCTTNTPLSATLPHLASPCLTLPHLASPCLTLPHPAPPCPHSRIHTISPFARNRALSFPPVTVTTPPAGNPTR